MDAPVLGYLDSLDNTVWCSDGSVLGKPTQAYDSPKSCAGSEPCFMGARDDWHGRVGVAGVASRAYYRIRLNRQPDCRGRGIALWGLARSRESPGVIHPFRGPLPYAYKTGGRNLS